jgi:hypothetical protein
MLIRVASLIDEHGLWREDLVRRTFPPIDANIILQIKLLPRIPVDF